jgi:hypothetical protein
MAKSNNQNTYKSMDANRHPLAELDAPWKLGRLISLSSLFSAVVDHFHC